MTQTMQRPQQTQQAQQPQYEISESDKKRQEKIAAAWKAYEGELEPPLKKMPDGTDPNVMSNRCVGVVNGGISFLFGKPLDISCEEGAPQEAKDFLDDVWGRQEVRTPMLQKLAMNGALAGEAFMRIVPSQEDDTFRLVVIDPSTVFLKTAPQDCEDIQLFCIQYSCMEKINGTPREVFYREEIVRIDPNQENETQEYYEDINAAVLDLDITWQIQHWTQVSGTGQMAKPTGWTAVGPPIIWPYPFPPIFCCQNLPKANDVWGIPDITPDLIGINKSLNLVQSCISLIEILYGHPILYATGTGEQIITLNPGVIHGLPLSESKIVAVNIVSDVPNALTFAANLRSDIDEQSSVPGVATGRLTDMPRGNLSGIAIELLFMPLLKKTEAKRCTYGELLINVSKALLVLNRMSGDIDITLNWEGPLPHDDLPALQAAMLKKQIGVSDATLQREQGYDPDEELELSQTEDAQKLTAFSQGQGLPPMPPNAPGMPGQPSMMQPGQAMPMMGGQS